MALNANAFAQLPVSTLAVGAHTMSAQYNGDTNNAGSASNTVNETVVPDATMISIGSSSPTAVVGVPVTFRSTIVNVVTPAAIPTGTVTFTDGTTVLGTAPLDGSGGASLTTAALGVGAHTIKATYNGDTNDAGSVSSLSQTVSQDTTTTTLVPSATPSVVGQAVTFTATVAGATQADGMPTGSVTFSDGTTVLGTAPLVNGSAALATSSLALGTHTITATYGGDALHRGSTSSGVSQPIGQDATTISLASSGSPSNAGQAVKFAATVTVVYPGAATPTGTVTFSDGTTVLGTAPLDATGYASFTTSALGAGNHYITASYGGDANDRGGTSSALAQAVNRNATTTAVSSSPAPSVVGQSVTLTASVVLSSPWAGAATPSGTVTFYDGSKAIGTATLSGGLGSLTTSALGLGTHAITAVYAGDALNAGDTSAALTQTVNTDATTTTLVSSADPSPLGQSVTFTASVAVVTPGAGTPTGVVTFKDGNTVLATAPLVNGVATLTRSNLTQGAHTITAVYTGDTNDRGSTSAALAQAVQAGSRISLASSKPNAKYGKPVNFRATVATVAPGTGIATGVITFYENGVVIGTATLNSRGVAVFSTLTLSRGTHKIYAVYGGDSGHQAVTSAPITETIS